MLVGNLITLVYDFSVKFCICRISRMIALNGRIGKHGGFFGCFAMNQYTLAENQIHILFSNTMTKMYKICRIKWKTELETSLSEKMLYVGIHHPSFGRTLTS